MKTKDTMLQAPLKCWDIYSSYLQELAVEFNKHSEIEILKNYKTKFGWDCNIETLLNDQLYDALVLTDFDQNIQWVNKEFTKMTGYPSNFAKGKTPNFLQGKNTSDKTLENIRKHIDKGECFKETIINYRQNGEEYNCEIYVFPLKNSNNTISHFLALEYEIKRIDKVSINIKI